MSAQGIYHTIVGPSSGNFSDRGSKFLAFAYPISEAQNVKTRLIEIKKLHPKARHYCYAYRLGESGDIQKSSDDGEPSGTAGKPILNQILSSQLTNILIIVVRYFGGSLLGTAGLIHAYKEAAAASISLAQIITKHIQAQFRFQCSPQTFYQVIQYCKQLEVEILHLQEDQHQMEVNIPINKQFSVFNNLKQKLEHTSIQIVDNIPEINGLIIKHKSS